MFLLTEKGRVEYLAFLRNLPVQALLFFLGILFIRKGLNGHSVTPVFLGGGLLAMAALAAWVSTGIFIDTLFKERIGPAKARALAAYPQIEAPLWARLRQAGNRWLLLKVELAETFVVVAVAYVGFVAAILQATLQTLSLLHGGITK